MPEFEKLSVDSPVLIGNWWPFPPPEEGYYKIRRILTPVDDSGVKVEYYGDCRITTGHSGRLMVWGRRCQRMRADLGWQFSFPWSRSHGYPVRFRPFMVKWETRCNPPVRLGREDISQALPIAHSIEEARYIVRKIPDRWPTFRHIHIEFTEEWETMAS